MSETPMERSLRRIAARGELRRILVSLDTIRPETQRCMTYDLAGSIGEARRAIEAALSPNTMIGTGLHDYEVDAPTFEEIIEHTALAKTS